MRCATRAGFVIALVLVLSTVTTQEARAQATLVLQPDDTTGNDACVTDIAPDSNYGAWTDFTINFGGGNNHGLIEFDISGLPPGAVVTSATLEVYENSNCSTNQNAIEVHLNSGAWSEATVTWNNAPAYGPSVVTNSGETAACEVLIFDVTGPVQDWADGTTTNYGFRLTGPGSTNVVKYISSSENGTAADRPILRIEYQQQPTENIPTLSEWGMIILSTLIAAAACAMLWRRRTANREA
jgi:hypothetical protein